MAQYIRLIAIWRWSGKARHFSRVMLLGVVSGLILAAVLYFMSVSNRLDFNIFHSAGRAMLRGRSPYDWYGPHQLPYQYMPWMLWLLAPLSFLSIRTAWVAFVGMNLALLAAVFLVLRDLYESTLEGAELAFLYALALLLSGLTMWVGQLDIILLAAAVLAIVLVHRQRPMWAGTMFPLLAIKPHLMIIFIPALLWRGGKRVVSSGLVTLAVLLVLSFLWRPMWISDMLHVVIEGQLRNDPLRWNFATLAGLLGLPRHWNYAMSVLLIPLGATLIYRIGHLPSAVWLSIALAVSLFTAPYAFAYDLPLLVPALFWLTRSWSFRSVFLWLLSVFACLIARYSSGAYLVTVLVVAASFWRAVAWTIPASSSMGTIGTHVP